MLRIANSQLLVMHEVLHDAARHEDVERECEAFVRRAPGVPRSVYAAPSRDRHLLLEGHDSPEGWGHTAADARRLRESLAGWLDRELRSSLLVRELVVKQRELPTPASRQLQVRYIEVPPRVLGEYREWRARTIFPYVRAASTVDAFSAYYSLVSGSPGVYFFSEFSCDREAYVASFATPEYREIVKQAAEHYIADGVAGLRTEEWSLVSSTEQW